MAEVPKNESNHLSGGTVACLCVILEILQSIARMEKSPPCQVGAQAESGHRFRP